MMEAAGITGEAGLCDSGTIPRWAVGTGFLGILYSPGVGLRTSLIFIAGFSVGFLLQLAA